MIAFKAETVGEGIQRIYLGGSLDIEGTAKVELKMTSITSTQKTFVILDLTDLRLLASLGIGLIYRCLKAVRLRGGNMVIYNPQPGVAMVLEHSNSQKVLPILSNFEEALRVVKAPAA
jgi:anti-anti-sigma factor